MCVYLCVCIRVYTLHAYVHDVHVCMSVVHVYVCVYFECACVCMVIRCVHVHTHELYSSKGWGKFMAGGGVTHAGLGVHIQG